MIYLIGEIALFLGLALALGLVVGWLLRGLVAKRSSAEATRQPENQQTERRAETGPTEPQRIPPTEELGPNTESAEQVWPP